MTVGHFAEAIGVSSSMVCPHVPFHLLVRADKPLRDWSLARPIVFLSIFTKSEPITVAAAAVTKLSASVPFTSLKYFLKTELVRACSLPGAIRPKCHKD